MELAPMSFLGWLLIGALAGWLAGRIVEVASTAPGPGIALALVDPVAHPLDRLGDRTGGRRRPGHRPGKARGQIAPRTGDPGADEARAQHRDADAFARNPAEW